MSPIIDALTLIFTDVGQWFPLFKQHVILSGVALFVSLAIGVPGGALLTRYESISFAVISVANLGRTIPSLALLALAYPLVGTGFTPSVIALVALGLPPILLTTYTGVREVDADVADAAKGMGLSSKQRLIQAELPVAAPVILGGIRTSAVQIVASASLASLIGGGGLGEMIMAGLSNLRYDLLIAGALLTALLAAATEVGFALLESRGLPLGIRLLRATPAAQALGYEAGGGIDKRRWKIVLVGMCIACAAFVGAGNVAGGMIAGIGRGPLAGANGPLPEITIGSKDFTEQRVLGELYAQALEAQGFPVKRQLDLGATRVANRALRQGDIDLYPEYTGTSLTTILKTQMPVLDDVEGGGGPSTDNSRSAMLGRAVYDKVRSGYQKRGVDVLAQTPFSNGNAVVVTKQYARAHKLKKISDLAKIAPKMSFGSITEASKRPDGLPLLKQRYGLNFKSVTNLKPAQKYRMLKQGKVDAIWAFETDGRIASNNMVVLQDDKAIWPPYHAAPVVSSDFAEKAGPALPITVNSVTRLLDADTMRALNAQVDTDGRTPQDVAAEFLKEKGLDKKGDRPLIRIGSKNFTEQFVLGELYAQALEARGFPVERRLNLGATAVADGAVRKHRIDLYPEYTGTSWTAVLRKSLPKGITADELHAGVVKGYKKRGLTVLESTPFSNGNAMTVTQATAKKHNLKTMSDLAKVSGSMTFGVIPGFDQREDGPMLLEAVYGMKFGKVKSYENGLKYKALVGGKIEAVQGFETDGQIASNNLVALTDDLRAWPPYQVTPIINSKLIKEVGPEFAATLNEVSSLLSADEMRKMNSAVEEDGKEPDDVARKFLLKHNMVW